MNVNSHHPAAAVKNPIYKRTARIYYQNISAMQKTPSLDFSGWKITFECTNMYKTKNMGWAYTEDTRSVRPIKCASLEEAIEMVRELGLLNRLQL